MSSVERKEEEKWKYKIGECHIVQASLGVYSVCGIGKTQKNITKDTFIYLLVFQTNLDVDLPF